MIDKETWQAAKQARKQAEAQAQAQAQRIKELEESRYKLSEAFDKENERACKAEAQALAFSRKLGEEETRRREERDEAEAFAQRQADTIEALTQANQKLRGMIEEQADTIEALRARIEAHADTVPPQELEYIRALAKRDVEALSLQASLEQAQAEAQAFKELYREAQARKERALIVARNRKAEALSLCRKLAQADQAQAQAEELSQAQADKLWEYREELAKAEALIESQASLLAGALAQAHYINELESRLNFQARQLDEWKKIDQAQAVKLYNAQAEAQATNKALSLAQQKIDQAQAIIVGMDEKLFKAEERERALAIKADQARKELDATNQNLTIKYLEAQARSEAQARTIEELRKELAEARQAYLLGILPL